MDSTYSPLFTQKYLLSAHYSARLQEYDEEMFFPFYTCHFSKLSSPFTSRAQLKTFTLIFYSKQAVHLPLANFSMCHKDVTCPWGMFDTHWHPPVCDVQ